MIMQNCLRLSQCNPCRRHGNAALTLHHNAPRIASSVWSKTEKAIMCCCVLRNPTCPCTLTAAAASCAHCVLAPVTSTHSGDCTRTCHGVVAAFAQCFNEDCWRRCLLLRFAPQRQHLVTSLAETSEVFLNVVQTVLGKVKVASEVLPVANHVRRLAHSYEALPQVGI